MLAVLVDGRANGLVAAKAADDAQKSIFTYMRGIVFPSSHSLDVQQTISDIKQSGKELLRSFATAQNTIVTNVLNEGLLDNSTLGNSCVTVLASQVLETQKVDRGPSLTLRDSFWCRCRLETVQPFSILHLQK